MMSSELNRDASSPANELSEPSASNTTAEPAEQLEIWSKEIERFASTVSQEVGAIRSVIGTLRACDTVSGDDMLPGSASPAQHASTAVYPVEAEPAEDPEADRLAALKARLSQQLASAPNVNFVVPPGTGGITQEDNQ